MDKEVRLADIGFCVAKLTLTKDPTSCGLHIMAPADGSGDFYIPAESIHVWQRQNIERLRDFLNEWYPQTKGESDARTSPV